MYEIWKPAGICDENRKPNANKGQGKSATRNEHQNWEPKFLTQKQKNQSKK